MALLYVILSGDGVGNGEYFQTALLLLGILCLLYVVAYVVLRRKRSKAALTNDASQDLPHGMKPLM